MRSLFLKIFLWFLLAQVLIGAALYALAVAVQSSPEEVLRSGVGASLEARAQAAAVAYESGGRAALSAAWSSPRGLPRAPWPPPEDGSPPPPERRPRPGRGRHGGPEDRSSACLSTVRRPSQGAAAQPQGGPMLLVGQPLSGEASGILGRALSSGQAALVTSGGESWLARAIQTQRGGLYVAAIRLRPREEVFDPFRAWSGPGGLLRLAVVALTMGAVCYALARYLTAPAIKLRHATQMLAEGDLSARVAPQMGRRRDELADLGRDFDRMAGRIQALVMAEKRLLADISHELRSPLARMQVALDLMQGTVEGDACKYLERIERESHRLNELIGQLLTLSRLESGHALAHREPIDLASLVREVVADADFEALSRNRRVVLTRSEPSLVLGDDHLLRSAIENVVRNATRYTPEGSHVEVALSHGQGAEHATISVRDRGPGVPEDSLPRLFDPFYRAEAARDRQSGGGVGLGLSITARAVRLHAGQAVASNAPGGGLLLEIQLPLHQE